MEQNKATRIAVIGAGISGLVAAWCLSHHGYDVTIFEKESQVGGHAKAIPIEVKDDWVKLCKKCLLEIVERSIESRRYRLYGIQ